ncbi:hypothetical protein BHE74_00030853 [Ensete ventricosum]|nr:hypothetical protein BHE74_00030853 [Ensete ventricosum]RZS02531.1 hypothetical protein BHM03_00032591 [Ensete ventricosum]
MLGVRDLGIRGITLDYSPQAVSLHLFPSGYRYVDCPLSGGTAKIDRRRSIEGGKGKKKEVPRVVLARALSLPAGRTRVIAIRGSLARHRRPRVAPGSRASHRRPRVVAARGSPASRRRPRLRAIFLLCEMTERLPAEEKDQGDVARFF